MSNGYGLQYWTELWADNNCGASKWTVIGHIQTYGVHVQWLWAAKLDAKLWADNNSGVYTSKNCRLFRWTKL